MTERFCHSCAAPLSLGFQGPAQDYCKYCTDEHGELKPREEVQQGLAQWLKSWGPGLDDATAMARAAHYMKAMPAWAD